jgi:lysine-specific permease
MYSSTRILWYLGKIGQAPKFVTNLNKHSLPITALILTSLVGSVVFVSSFIGNGVVFTYLVQISSLCGFLAWFGIALSHYKFRRNILPKLGGVGVLKYRAKFYPWAQIISMIAIVLIVVAQFVTLGDHYNILDFVMIYSSLILFFILYVGHKLYSLR